MKEQFIPFRPARHRGTGWLLLWLFGVPMPLLALLLVLRGLVARAP